MSLETSLPYFDHDGKPVSREAWSALFDKRTPEDDSWRRQTWVGDRWVSTVWLGLNHQFGDGPPLIWETMIFLKGDAGAEEGCWRYPSREDAFAGHDRVVRALREGRDPAEVDAE